MNIAHQMGVVWNVGVMAGVKQGKCDMEMIEGGDVLSEIFDFDNWDQSDTMCFVFNDCTFKKMFGLFRKDEKVKYLTVNFSKGILEETNDKGVVLRRCTIGLVAYRWERYVE